MTERGGDEGEHGEKKLTSTVLSHFFVPLMLLLLLAESTMVVTGWGGCDGMEFEGWW